MKDFQYAFPFSDDDFAAIRDLVIKKSGIALSEQKKTMVYGRLVRRLRALNLSDFHDYLEKVENDKKELTILIDAITTNVTNFYREKHHFEFLTNTLFPNLFKEKKVKEINIWSAGCSTGQEPYSIAMTFLDSPYHNINNLNVTASDLSFNVLDVAKQGEYTMDQSKGLTPADLKRWFKTIKKDNKEIIQIKPEVKKLIKFQELNLLGDWSFKIKFDVIFCRNVIIYFNTDVKKMLFERYANQLNEGGYLILGHAENILKLTDKFERVGQTIFKKKTKEAGDG